MTRASEASTVTEAAAYTHIWQPLEIGRTVVRNRIMVSPHGVVWGGTNLPFPRQIAYYSERARGGAGLVCVGASIVSRHSRASGAGPSVLSEPAVVPMFERLANAVHGYGGRVFIESAESGSHDHGRRNIDDWHPARAPSAIPSVLMNESPVAVDKAFIRDLLEDHVRAAVHLQTAGIDGMTLHAAHSYLLGQFLSPAYNRRTDEYGSSVENNCRILVEIATGIRDRLGDTLTLGIRLSVDEYIGEAGITPELNEQYVEHLAGTGLFEFFDVSTGGYHSLYRSVPSMSVPEGHIVTYASRIRELVAPHAKVFVAGRIRHLAQAEEIVATGAADMVAMTRAHIADPFIVKKHREGRGDEINHCVGGNECIYNSHKGFGMSCVVNPSTGREQRWGDDGVPAITLATKKRLLIVGGGPAGLKAAVTAARRGFEVTLAEQEPGLGGGVRLLARLPTRGDWSSLVEDLTRQVHKFGVEVKLGVSVEAPFIAEHQPDVVVLATGATWDRTGFTPLRPDRHTIPGLDSGRVVDPESALRRVLDDPHALGERVLIVDETGWYLPLGIADVLAAAGVAVDVITRLAVLGDEPRETHEMPHLMPRLVANGVAMSTETLLEAVIDDGAVTRSIWGGQARTVRADSIVMCMLRSPRNRLFDEIAGGGYPVHVIGDALAPRRVAEAVYEGERLAREL